MEQPPKLGQMMTPFLEKTSGRKHRTYRDQPHIHTKIVTIDLVYVLAHAPVIPLYKV